MVPQPNRCETYLGHKRVGVKNLNKVDASIGRGLASTMSYAQTSTGCEQERFT
jgi:hypothetical protein